MSLGKLSKGYMGILCIRPSNCMQIYNHNKIKNTNLKTRNDPPYATDERVAVLLKQLFRDPGLFHPQHARASTFTMVVCTEVIKVRILEVCLNRVVHMVQVWERSIG